MNTPKSKTPFCFIDGKIIPLTKATLPVTDIAVLRGYAVFDAMFASGSKVLHLEDHLKRFFASVKMAGITIKYSKTEIIKALNAVLRKNAFAESRIRIIATGGQTINSGLEFYPKTSSFFIIIEPHAPIAKTHYENGVSLMTTEYKRSMPSAKTTNYMHAVSLQRERNKKKAFEILYTFNRNIFECSTSNFFLVKGKELLTADAGILKGITRKFILSIAKKAGLKAIERTITMKDLKSANEAFITATYKGALPVVKIDEIVIGNGKVGHATQLLQDLYLKAHNN